MGHMDYKAWRQKKGVIGFFILTGCSGQVRTMKNNRLGRVVMRRIGAKRQEG